MKADLLLKLADIMERRPKDGYYQGAWINFKGEYAAPTEEEVELRPVFKTRADMDRNDPFFVNIKEGACGSAMCVLGTACVDMAEETGLSFFTDHLPKINGVRLASSIQPAIRKGNRLLLNWEAGAEAFGIPVLHARILFGSDDLATTMFYTGLGEEEAKQIVDDHEFHDHVCNVTVAQRLRDYVRDGGNMPADVIANAECHE